MNENTFDGIARDAAAASGRRALLTLGGAGLVAALAGSAGADAKKKGKKGNKAKKKCNKQKNQCREGVEEFCLANSAAPQECIDGLTPCCAQCNVEFAVICTVEAFTA